MKTALLLIDIQTDYFESGAMPLVGANEAAANARMILNRFREEQLPVIFIKHIAARSNASFFLPDTPGGEISDIIKPMSHEKIVVKHFPNSFRDTDLLSHLQSAGITRLVVCGMMTHMCIDATVRAAKDLSFDVILVGDACATRDLQVNSLVVESANVHNSFLAALSYFYADLRSTRELLEGAL
ncbi:MAG: cysteine hydrolase [Sphingobacteriia bacterium]|nr:cysteine hydrolase [Sphingobacteriia bacterium]